MLIANLALLVVIVLRVQVNHCLVLLVSLVDMNLQLMNAGKLVQQVHFLR